MGSAIWSSRASAIAASSISLLVTATATIAPLSASTPIDRLRQNRRRDVPCFSTSHCAGSAALQAGAVRQPMQRAGSQASERRRLQHLGPAAQGGMVRHGKVKPEPSNDGADQSLGLPQCEAKHHAHRQGRADGGRRNAAGRPVWSAAALARSGSPRL